MIYYSAHGVPESYIEAGDPYQRHIEECVRLISTEVSNQLANDATRPEGSYMTQWLTDLHMKTQLLA